MADNASDHLAPLAPASSAVAELLALAAPTVAQMASYTVMQFIDTWLLSYLGDAAPTAAGNGGIMAMAVISFGMGCIWVVNTLVSQNFGAGNAERCGRYLWQGIWFAIAFSAIASIAAYPLATWMFTRFGHSADIIPLEAAYFRILILGQVLKLIGIALGQFLLAIDRPRLVLISAISGVAVNILAAWILVLGRLGVHSHGVVGAGWAQNIGVGCEMLVLVGFALKPQIRRRFGLLHWRPYMRELGTLLRVGVPSGVQFIGDILAWALFSNVILGIRGQAAMAANTFMMRFMVVSFMPAVGISTAVTALSGRYIGMHRADLVARRANLAFAVTASYMVACGLAFILGRHRLMHIFSNDPKVLKIGATYLVYAGIYQFFDALYIVYNGALRGAGDTFVPAVATAVLCWGVTVGGGYMVARYVPQLGDGGPWMAATCYGIILGGYLYARFRRGKWKYISLESPPCAHSNVTVGSTTVPAIVD